MNIDKLKDEAEKLRMWMKFWLNIVIAIFIGFSSVSYAFIVDKMKASGAIPLLFTLLTIFLIVAKIVAVIEEK